MALFVPVDIRLKEIERHLVVLDLRAETYSIFDPVATLMWKALILTETEDEALEVLAREYLAETARIQADLREFKRRCLEEGFLRETGESRKAAVARPMVPGRRRRVRILHAWWCLFRTVRSLGTAGLAGVYYEYACLPTLPGALPDDDAALSRALSAFSMAENFFLMKRAPNDCLPRSLALFRFLRSMGFAVEHCIGVRRVPFHAHAWVEFRSRVLLDHPSRASSFTPIARISA